MEFEWCAQWCVQFSHASCSLSQLKLKLNASVGVVDEYLWQEELHDRLRCYLPKPPQTKIWIKYLAG
eukprot:scaffold101_cov80-Skeletonema_menzelii.AAC.1